MLVGVIGIILYLDLVDYFVFGVQSYFKGWNFFGIVVQRGNVLNLNGVGDFFILGYLVKGNG